MCCKKESVKVPFTTKDPKNPERRSKPFLTFIKNVATTLTYRVKKYEIHFKETLLIATRNKLKSYSDDIIKRIKGSISQKFNRK